MSNPYTSYDQVPWYRRWWFAAIGCLIFMPAIAVMAFTGNFYFSKKGSVKEFAPWYKFLILGLCLLSVMGYVLEGKSQQFKSTQSKSKPVEEPRTISASELDAMVKEALEKSAVVRVPGLEQAKASAASAQESPESAIAPSKPNRQEGEGCYEAKLKDYQSGMGLEAPVSHDVMNEWRGECGMPAL